MIIIIKSELLDTMDTEIPVPERDINKPFLLSIEGTYHIAGRGTVATGTVDGGKIKVGDDIEIVGNSYINYFRIQR